MAKNIYQENGFIDRADYFNHLSEDYGVPLYEIYVIASVLGNDEDFDGLLDRLEDYGPYIL